MITTSCILDNSEKNFSNGSIFNPDEILKNHLEKLNQMKKIEDFNFFSISMNIETHCKPTFLIGFYDNNKNSKNNRYPL